jgi:hypothetical protein
LLIRTTPSYPSDEAAHILTKEQRLSHCINQRAGDSDPASQQLFSNSAKNVLAKVAVGLLEYDLAFIDSGKLSGT